MYTRIWYTLWLAKFDTSCQHQRVVDADKKCDMACPCEGHPPSSHAWLNNCTASAWRFPKGGYFTDGIKRFSSTRVSGKTSHRHSSNRIWKLSLIFQLFPSLINALQRNAVSKIIVVTPLVAIMKGQVEQLQSIEIRALAIRVDEEEDEEWAGKMDRLDCLWKSWKPAV